MVSGPPVSVTRASDGAKAATRKLLVASHDVLSGAIGRGGGFRYSSLHQSVDVSKDVTLLPPVFVAKECAVGTGATVGSRTSMGKGCTIGEGAHVEGSILFEGVWVGEGTVVRNSIVGPGAIIYGGCIVRELSVLGAG